MAKEKRKGRKERAAARGRQVLSRAVFSRSFAVVLLLAVQALFIVAFFGLLQRHVVYATGSMAVIGLVMMIYILNTRRDPAYKLTWCVLIGAAPVFGTLLYFYIVSDMGHLAEKKRLQQIIDESAPQVADQSALMERLRREEPDFAPLAAYGAGLGFPVYENTAVTYFPLGEDKFRALIPALEKAEKFIFLEYFIIQDGHMWGDVLEILKRKAAQGVEVRLMYDGTCSFSKLPIDYPRQMEAAGIQCRVFSPIRPFISTAYNNRDHRKILVIDGHTGFTGGVNLADEYINEASRFGHWKDTAVMLQGDGVRSLTLMFLQLWNAWFEERAYEPYLLAPGSGPREAQGYVMPYGDSPLDDELTGEMVYFDILNTARDYVYIMTPYLILDAQMVTALSFAAKRGVDVKLILPHIPDKKYAFTLAKSHYRELLEGGVEIYEYTPGFVHAKQFVSDGKKAVVGTINLDYRSLYLHFECGVYLYKTPVIQDIYEDFQKTLAQCQQITLEDVKKEKLRSKLAAAVLKVVAPLM
ncbi:MAG: cardiolipin synthase [Oscillospiraceae bacterium]|nr:cardiolipin synthase [Oscillospiraceae bacterium]